MTFNIIIKKVLPAQDLSISGDIDDDT